MLGKLMVVVIPLLGTVCSLYVIGSVPACPEFTKQFCACNGTENIKIVPMRMCSYGNECKPCAMDLQDNIDCSVCPGGTCPVCSENESSLRTTNKKADIKTLFARSGRKSRRSVTTEDPLPHDKWCVFERNMLNGQVECIFTTHSKECLLSCYEPYSVNGQRELAFACKRKENVWKPEIQACEDKSEKYNEPEISKEYQQPQQHSMENVNEPVSSAKSGNDRNSDFHFGDAGNAGAGSASEDDDFSFDSDDDGKNHPHQPDKAKSVITHTSGPPFKDDDKGSEKIDEDVMKDFYDLLNSD